MATRTVLQETHTAVTSYSSGVLAVGDLHELYIDLEITAVPSLAAATYYQLGDNGDGTFTDYYNYTSQYSFTVSRFTAFDVPVPAVIPTVLGSTATLAQVHSGGATDPPDAPDYIGAPTFTTGMTSINVVFPSIFGDRIQVDLVNPQGFVLTFTVSIIGK